MTSKPKPFSPTQAAILKPLVKVFSGLNTWLYRLTNGKLGGTYLHGIPVLLLTVVGRKSGRRITVPLTYIEDGDRFIIAASRTGMDQHPLWYLNLEATPEVEVQIGSVNRPMRAHTADDAERAHYWPKLVAANPDYGFYQERTTRKIPVVMLAPR
jgi:deazaflavin-dependent oxidoreductase (nitroreductase family)